MSKEQFNKLNLLEQIKYINMELANNNSITSICKKLGIGRSTIRDRFKKSNYTYSKNLNMYISTVDTFIDKKEPVKLNNECRSSDIHIENNKVNTSILQVDTVSDIINKSDEEIKANLLDLVTNYDVLKAIIELHKRNTSVIKQQILIDLEDSESKLTTVRVNSKVLDQFNDFCKNNNQYTKVDLLSQAIKNFVITHS
ncbi:MAG: hypothetical protein ACRDDM_07710 [Paraclostridium sp.]